MQPDPELRQNNTSVVHYDLVHEINNKGALLEFIQECEKEAALRQDHSSTLDGPWSCLHLEGGRDSIDGNSPVDALVSLVRREVRCAIEQEFITLRRSSLEMHSALGLGEVLINDDCPGGSTMRSEAEPSTSASSCAEMPIAPHKEALASALAKELLHDVEVQLAEQKHILAGLQEVLSRQALQWEMVWKEEAELRAEGDQQTQSQILARLGSRLDSLEAHVKQVTTSVGSLARLQVELGSEAKVRQEADGRLQIFLKDLRGHFVSEVEDLRDKHQKLDATVEGVRGLVSGMVDFLDLRNHPCEHGGCVTGPDELEASFLDKAGCGSCPM